MCLGIFAGCKPKQVEEPYVPKKYGDFYTLEEAYEQGLLTVDDLKNIAYYQHGTSDDPEFEPKPKEPEVLSAETELMIKETMVYDILQKEKTPLKDFKSDYLTIDKYYGIYNNLAIVMIEGYYMYVTEPWITKIGGVTFRYSDGNSIIVWKQYKE